MNRSRLLPVSLITISFALAAAAFYPSQPAASHAGSITAATPMLEPRSGHTATLLPSGKVLIAGGWVGHGGTDSAELYDPATGKFTVIAKMTLRRGRPSATLLPDGDVLIAGGEKEN